jgi:hypothetical protein
MDQQKQNIVKETTVSDGNSKEERKCSVRLLALPEDSEPFSFSRREDGRNLREK